MHYLTDGATPTTECPGVGQAAAGHLCMYEGWAFNAAYSHVVSPLDGTQSTLPTHGFAIYWNSSNQLANVVGSWAHTVPSSAPADLPAAPLEVPESMIGSMP